jgi:hypothetical protein
MPVLPKYQLKQLFESGDLITQATLIDLIDSTYNPEIVAGSNITINRVKTPSGTVVTINSSTIGIPLTYDLTSAQDGTNVDVILTGSNATSDVIKLSPGTNIALTDDGSNGILIDAIVPASSYTNLVPTPQNFPANSPFDNIPINSTFTNQTFTEMMDLMLYPELFPSISNQYNGFSLNQAVLQEIGDSRALTFTSTFNRGSISPAYGTNGFRSGLPNAYVYTGTGLSSPIPSTSLSDTQHVAAYTILQGTQSWTSAVDYDAGEQPLSSKGNIYLTPLPAGTATPNTVSINGVYPPFATTNAIATLTKQSLQTMTTLIEVDMQAEVIGGPKQTIDIPDVWTAIVGLQIFNTLSGVWDIINLSTFTTSQTTQTIQGNVIPYTQYEHNGSTVGARKLRFTT